MDERKVEDHGAIFSTVEANDELARLGVLCESLCDERERVFELFAQALA